MAINAHKWNVSTWVDGARSPVESVDFLDEETAKRFAKRREEEIKRMGGTHKVSVGPVFLQA